MSKEENEEVPMFETDVLERLDVLEREARSGESEGALTRIAAALEAALDMENEHSLAYELWRIRKAVETLTGQSYAD